MGTALGDSRRSARAASALDFSRADHRELRTARGALGPSCFSAVTRLSQTIGSLRGNNEKDIDENPSVWHPHRPPRVVHAGRLGMQLEPREHSDGTSCGARRARRRSRTFRSGARQGRQCDCNRRLEHGVPDHARRWRRSSRRRTRARHRRRVGHRRRLQEVLRAARSPSPAPRGRSSRPRVEACKARRRSSTSSCPVAYDGIAVVVQPEEHVGPRR